MSYQPESESPIEIFYSYSHRDEELRRELEKQLSLLERSGVIRTWHDRKIGAGGEWEVQISEHLNRAHIILLLISSDFLASDYCYDVEMSQALKRHEAGDARVIPIILRDVDWMRSPFGKLQALPTDARPVTSWPNQDEAFANIARGIRAAVENLAPRGPSDTTGRNLPAAPNLPRLLPYLCDRSDQDRELNFALNRHKAERPRRPFVCVIHGDELECHGEFLERMQHTVIPRSLGFKHLRPEEYPLQWPTSHSPEHNLTRILWSNLGWSLLQNSGATREEILEFVAQHEKPILFSSALLTEDFLAHGTELFSAYLDFWDSWPDLPLSRTLIGVVCLKYRRSDRGGFFRRRNLKRVNEQLRSFLKHNDFSAHPGVGGVTLAELQAIRRSDVEMWIRNSQVRSVCEIQERDIRSLYERAELQTPEGCIAMEMLAEELKALMLKKPR